MPDDDVALPPREEWELPSTRLENDDESDGFDIDSDDSYDGISGVPVTLVRIPLPDIPPEAWVGMSESTEYWANWFVATCRFPPCISPGFHLMACVSHLHPESLTHCSNAFAMYHPDWMFAKAIMEILWHYYILHPLRVYCSFLQLEQQGLVSSVQVDKNAIILAIDAATQSVHTLVEALDQRVENIGTVAPRVWSDTLLALRGVHCNMERFEGNLTREQMVDAFRGTIDVEALWG